LVGAVTGIPRRDLVVGATATVVASRVVAATNDRLARIEERLGGRLGVAALDMTSGASIAHRAAERFAMCSTFKAMAVAALLARVDRGAERLDRFVRFGPRDLLTYAPVTAAAQAKAGGMALGDLCAAAIQVSDNTAANLILAAIGGPAGWTRFVRTLGDDVSRLDRTEPFLNTALPRDARDTTTPLAMLSDLRLVCLGEVLSAPSRQRLIDWMEGCQTGLARLRAGLPSSWPVGDKTGTGERGASGDIAVAYAPKGPILIAAYVAGAERHSGDERDAAFADVARIVAGTFRPLAAGAHG
jgi:beta-lactamase class A